MKRKISEKVLARMLFNISKENNVLDEVKKSLQKVEKLLKTNGHFLMLVQSKKINSSIKREILNTLLKDISHPMVNEVLSKISGSGTIISFIKLAKYFESRNRLDGDLIEIEATVSDKLNEVQINSMTESLNHILNKKANLSFKVDKSLVGGIRLRIDNILLDGSIKNQLNELSSKLLQI